MFLTRHRVRVEGRDQRRRDPGRPDQRAERSGLAVVEEILDDIDGIAFCHLGGTRRRAAQDRAGHRGGLRPVRAAGAAGATGARAPMSDDDGGGHPSVLVSNRLRPAGRRRSTWTALAGLARRDARSQRGRTGRSSPSRSSTRHEIADLHDAVHGRTRAHRRAVVPARRRRRRRGQGVRVLGDVVICAGGRGAQQPRATPMPSCGCWSCTGCCTCSATTTRSRCRARRDVVSPGALQRGDGAVIWLWVARARAGDPRLAPRDGRVVAHAHDPGEGARRSRTRDAATPPCSVKLETDPPRYLNSVYLAVMIVQNGSAILVAILAERPVRQPRASRSPRSCSRCCTSCFVEAMSKTFGVLHSDRMALALSPLVYFLGRLLAWPTRALIGLANVLLPGKGIKAGPFVCEEEIRSMAQVGSRGGFDRGGREAADPLDLRVRRHDRARGHGAATRHHRDRGRQGAARRAGPRARRTARRASPSSTPTRTSIR